MHSSLVAFLFGDAKIHSSSWQFLVSSLAGASSFPPLPSSPAHPAQPDALTVVYNRPLLFMATNRALFTPKRLTTPRSTVEISNRPNREMGACADQGGDSAPTGVTVSIPPPYTLTLLLESQKLMPESPCPLLLASPGYKSCHGTVKDSVLLGVGGVGRQAFLYQGRGRQRPLWFAS